MMTKTEVKRMDQDDIFAAMDNEEVVELRAKRTRFEERRQQAQEALSRVEEQLGEIETALEEHEKEFRAILVEDAEEELVADQAQGECIHHRKGFCETCAST